MRRTASLVVVMISLCVVTANAHHIKTSNSKTMPVTTSSPKARDLYERAMQDYENLYLERCNLGWRAATQADPDFALAYAWIAFNSRSPEEAASAREKARALAEKVTPGEKLMIRWITDVQENKFISGISAMNDMLEMYPKDKRLYYLAANWLMGANVNDQAEKLLLRALDIDENYPAALNDIAYVYARSGQFDKAFSAMDRYVALLPNEPNPQDSYGEISRMAGNFDGALDHYRAALKIDPDFITSQLGLGDTYALMGDQAKARPEYDKAIAGAHTAADRLDYRLQKAMTWVRDGNTGDADKAFTEIAQDAHSQHFELEEAEAHLMMSMYQTDDDSALKHIEEAEGVLSHPSVVAQIDKDQKRARILRYRAVRAIHAGKQDLAQKAVNELATMAGGTRDGVIQQAYHGAAGALLMANQKYQDAISHLEEDKHDPHSLELLSQAYSQSEDFDKMHEVQAALRRINLPTMEQALVVIPARGKRPNLP